MRSWCRPGVARASVAVVVLVVAGVGGAVPVSAGVAAADQAPPTPRLLLNHEHVDALSLGFEDGALSMDAAADLESGNGQLFDPSEVLLQLKDVAPARAVVPDIPEYGFLGAPGDPLWIAPEVQDPDLVWAGWNTQRLGAGVFVDDVVQLHLRGVDGPGAVEAFMTDPIGLPIRIFSSTDPSLRSHTTSIGTHAHTSWAFGALGSYTLTFEATATTLAGTEVSTGQVEYRWLVGSLPTTTELDVSPASGQVGDDVTLTATAGAEAAPEGGMPGSITFLDGGTALGAAPLVDGVASLRTDELAAGTHQLSARFTPDRGTPHIGDAVLGSDSPAVAYTVTGSGPGPDPDPDPPVECPIEAVLDVGHVDVAARLVDGALVTQVKDTTQAGPPVWRDLETVAFHVTPGARTQVPAGGVFDFLGPAGSDVWVLPQVQDPELLWPGWNTEEIDYGQLDGPVTWRLDSVEGSGDLAVYQVGDFGDPSVLFDSSDPLPQALALDTPTHAHGNWAFDTEGIYRLGFSHTARLHNGADLSSAGTLAVAVGDVDLDELCPDGGVPDPPGGPGDPGGPDDPGDPAPGPPGSPGQADPAATPQPVANVPCPAPGSDAAPSSQDGSGPPSGEVVVLDDGHVDYAARVVDGDLLSQVKDGTTAGNPVWRDPSQVVFHVKPQASTQVPAGARFGFLGVSGATIWQIPQTQNPQLLWLGWNTEEIAAGDLSGPVTWTLDDVDGPGDLAVYVLGSFGDPTVLFDSGDGTGDSYEVPVGTHAHGNWAFSAEGVYRVTLTHTARLASGQAMSDTQTVTFAVGATDPTAVTPAARQMTSGPTSAASRTSANGCRLPHTGGDLGGMLLSGGLLVGAGSVVTVAAWRRRRRILA